MPASPPDGYQAVIPYLVLNDAADFIAFAQQSLGATEIRRFPGDNGRIMHAEIRIGDSVIMLGDAGGKTWNAMLHVYVPECDAAYKRALEGGATSVREPGDNPDGDRRAGVTDRWGNEWWFATPMK
jgi:uncharacterized glyoxalase superfamily protein PhnB